MAFHSFGHYGSSAFDPMDGTSLNAILCDPCVTNGIANGRIRERPPAPTRPADDDETRRLLDEVAPVENDSSPI